MTMTVESSQDTTADLAAMRRRRTRPVVAVLAAVVLLSGAAVVWWLGRGPGAAPYADASATARITLCQDGAAVTSGSTRSLADSVVAAGAGSGTATLFAYQPRHGVEASSWSGLQLTPSVPFTATPSIALGADDTTVAQFSRAFPLVWDGWVQLRLVTATSGQAPGTSYSAVDLHLDGDHWTAFNPGHAPCA